MVSVVFKTVYLFLTLFALPHALAAPDPAALGPRASIRDEALNVHNAFRTSHGLHNLIWDTELSGLAALHASACKNEPTTTLILENAKVANSITEAFKSWISDPSSDSYLIIASKEVTKIGCGIFPCSGRLGVVCTYNKVKGGGA